jgi:hypothetical protein
LNHSLAIMLIVALMLSACFKESHQSTPATGDATTNQKPTVSGTPPTSVLAGLAYDFTPIASDPDGDTLKFRIANKPAWANFDVATGRLSGTPQAADVGVVPDIKISVTDGTHSAGLPRFAIAVNHIGTGSATLSWYPPTQNADGSPLTDLSGYRVYFGLAADALNQVITIENPGLTAFVVDNLSSATWHFSMTSFNSSGVESSRSPTVAKTVT